MKKERFLILVGLISLGRGPKPKQKTIDDAIDYINGGKGKRLSRALVDRAKLMDEKLKGCSLAKEPSFKLFLKTYDIKASDTSDVVAINLATNKPISKIAVQKGIYTSPAYSMKNNFEKFYSFRKELGDL